MRIHNKLFSIFIIFSLLLVTTFTLLVQWSIDKGMIDYVNTREVTALKPVIEELQQIYVDNGSWEQLEGKDYQFHTLLREKLAGSEFSLPPQRQDRLQPIPPRRKINNNRRQDSSKKDGFRGGLDFENHTMGDEQATHRFPPPSPQQQRHRPSPRDVRHNREVRRAPEPTQINSNKPKDKRFPGARPPAPLEPHVTHVNYALVNAEKNLIVGHYPKNKGYRYSAIIVKQKTVGFLAIYQRKQLTEGYELDFIEQQKAYLWLLAVGVMIFVIVITLPLARHLVNPIRQLTKGMHLLTQGRYLQSMPIERRDEFGDLSRDFNELASTLAQNETARKRWLANISHELRTPVAILRGELEAMIDNVRPLSIDNIHSANQEVQHLEHLINDLHALTSADIGGMKYRKEEIELTEFILKQAHKYQSYLADADLDLTLNNATEPMFIHADSTRLCQLMENLVNNCVKYASSGKQVNISLMQTNTHSVSEATIIIEDDGIGVSDEHLPHLFEHLYRVDDSRNRNSGGTGLGLSICAHIVNAHQGIISAKRSTLGGLAVIISLPLN